MKDDKSAIYPSRRDVLSMLAAGSLGALSPRLGWASPSKEKRPLNVLFLMCDQYRPDALGSYGDPYAITPTLDGLAASGASFRQTYCQVPICVGSRNCILTGRYAHSTGVVSNGFLANTTQVSFAQHLRSKGYVTACFGKLHTPGRETQDWEIAKVENGPDRDAGAAGLLPQLFHTNGTLRLGAPSPLPETESQEWKAAQETIKFLQASHDRPWLVQCSLVKPHPPLQPPQRYWDMIDRSRLQIPSRRYPANDLADANPRYWKAMQARGLDHLTDDQILDAMQGYYGNIAFDDNLLGRVLKQLDESGLRDNTVVIFTADHGEMLDHHRLWTKMVFFDPSVRIPLIMRLPGVISGGKQHHALVEHIDLFPSMMDLLGFETPASVEGKSFLPLVEGKTSQHKQLVYSEFPNEPMFLASGAYNPTRMQFDGRYKLVDNGPSIDPELYDHASDPLEITNLCHEPKQQARLQAMLKHLRSWASQDVVPLQPRSDSIGADA